MSLEDERKATYRLLKLAASVRMLGYVDGDTALQGTPRSNNDRRAIVEESVRRQFDETQRKLASQSTTWLNQISDNPLEQK